MRRVQAEQSISKIFSMWVYSSMLLLQFKKYIYNSERFNWEGGAKFKWWRRKKCKFFRWLLEGYKWRQRSLSGCHFKVE